VPGAKVVYEKFRRYVPRDEPASQAAGSKVARIDRVASLYTPDAATAMNGLLTGEFDLLDPPRPTWWRACAARPRWRSCRTTRSATSCSA
jgi:peptide/nickel transport system substrate-binding protein